MIDFTWADSENAKREEPLADTLKNGWQYSDPLVASHFNWIFNKIAETFQEKQKAFEVFKSEQSELIENLRTELNQTKTVRDHLVRGTSRAIFTLNANGLNTKLSPIYPFEDIVEPVPHCSRCNGYHDPKFDCHLEVGL